MSAEQGYLDGVPFQLTRKFYPQPRPQFNEIDIHIPIDALQDDYDFSLERSVVVEVETWQHDQKLEKERREEEFRIYAEEREARMRIEEEEARRKAEEEEVRKKLEENEARVKAEEEEVKRKAQEEEARVRAHEEALNALLRAQGEARLKAEEEEEARIRGQEEARMKAEEEVRLKALTAEEDRRLAMEASTANSFAKYYFPLLTSMANSRSMRERQNLYPTNLNQAYPIEHPSPINQVPGSNHNPFYNSTAQQFPTLSTVPQPPSNHYWSDGTGLRMPTYSAIHNPGLNGPLVNDPLKSNNSHHPPLPPSDISGSTSNGTHNTLL